MDIDVNLIIEKLLDEINHLKLDNIVLNLKLEKLIETTNLENDSGDSDVAE